ncbi:MAG: hypothetical protein ACRD8O_16300 [Bryobacteraceae bacterium]
MKHIDVTFDPHQTAAKDGLLPGNFLRVKNPTLGNLDVIAELRVEIKPDVAFFRGRPEIADQQQGVGRLVGIADYFGNKLVEPKVSAGSSGFRAVFFVLWVRHRALRR